MSLAVLQREFQAAVVAEDGNADANSDGRVAVYRNAYRSRLLECQRASFQRTWTWIGDEAFTAAACHHVIEHRPQGWTLDDLGRGFDATLAKLFPGDPEVAELAWLERAMQDVFTAPDVRAVEPEAFAARTAGYTEADWSELRLCPIPAIETRVVATDCVALWTAIDAGEASGDWSLDAPRTALVWRKNLRPRCRLLDATEAQALVSCAHGARFGALCQALVTEQGPQGVETAGIFLGRWLSDGLLQENSDGTRFE